ncbi:OsmC family protein [Roseateles sp. BYS180W]|uniref:OsmC family protein n=1 Tax=Roseateles rivi TaxID=3299028 RepID=A0ABW7FT09_9BURK
MSTHTADILWQRQAHEPFVDQRYSRQHLWRFDGGVQVPASSSPHVVPRPYSADAAVDPEEAFVASLSSCHMLWFLSLAAEAGWVVERYHDAAQGQMGRNAQGQLVVSLVTLRPLVNFSGPRQPTPQDIQALHHRAHQACFIANSVKSELRIEAQGLA